MAGFRITPSPRTLPSPTRAPCVTMHRLPSRASSSTTTGTAFGGSSTPPIPTPPARWTRSPICAHDPTGDDPYPRRPVVVLERDLVEILERSRLGHLHLLEPEQQQDRLLQPLVHDHV